MGVLEIRGLEYEYRDHRFRLVVEGFRVKSPCICGILGPNGSGKSTLLKLIVGILKPRRGMIRFNGVDLSRLGLRDRARLISYVGQGEAGLGLPFTVLQVVLLARTPWINPWLGPSRRDVGLAMSALTRLRAAHLAHRRFSSLSGGERQRVLLARAIVNKPRLLLLDEPLNNLDPRYRLEVVRLLREVVEEDDIICLVTIHDMTMASLMCDEVLLLRDGHVVAYGDADDVLTDENLKTAYEVEVCRVNVHGRSVIVPFKVIGPS